MSRRLFSAAAATALLLGLAACDDGKEGPATTAPPSIDIGAPSDGGGSMEPSDGGGTETDTAEPSASAPDIPAPDPADFAGMDEHTPEGAEQAFRYYIAVSMWAHQTGDNSRISELERPNCSSCEAFMEPFKELDEHNETWGEFSLIDINLSAHESGNYEYEILYDFSTTPHERPNNDFSERINVGKLEYSTVGGLVWQDDKWLLGAIKAEWGNDVLSS